MGFYEKFIALCNNRGCSAATAAREIGLSNSATTAWKKGAIPKRDTIERIALYFDVPENELLEDASAQSQEESERIADIYLSGIKYWSTDKAFTVVESTNIKAHFSILLMKYKEMLSVLGNAKYSQEYREAIKKCYQTGDSELVSKVKESYFRQFIEHQVDDLVKWCQSFPQIVAQVALVQENSDNSDNEK